MDSCNRDQLLVLNAGSSSLKFDVFSPWPAAGDPARFAKSVLEHVGEPAVPDIKP